MEPRQLKFGTQNHLMYASPQDAEENQIQKWTMRSFARFRWQSNFPVTVMCVTRHFILMELLDKPHCMNTWDWWTEERILNNSSGLRHALSKHTNVMYSLRASLHVTPSKCNAFSHNSQGPTKISCWGKHYLDAAETLSLEDTALDILTLKGREVSMHTGSITVFVSMRHVGKTHKCHAFTQCDSSCCPFKM